MEVIEKKDSNGQQIIQGTQKSSTAMSESSKEVSVEQTATGKIETSISQQKSAEASAEQTIEQNVQRNVQQQSSRIVQQSVTSSTSEEEEENNDEIVESSADAGDVDAKKQTSAPASKVCNNERSKVKSGQNDKHEDDAEDADDDETEQESEEIEESEDDVNVSVTIVMKKPPAAAAATTEVTDAAAATATEPVTSVDKQNGNQNKNDSASIIDPPQQQSDEQLKPKPIEVVKDEDSQQISVAPVTQSSVQPSPSPPETTDHTDTQDRIQNQESVIDEKNTTTSSSTTTTISSSTTATTTGTAAETTEKLTSRASSPIESDVKIVTGSTDKIPEDTPKLDTMTTESISARNSQGPTVGAGVTSSEIKQENIKNTLKEIISDIDRVIELEEEKTVTTSSKIITDQGGQLSTATEQHETFQQKSRNQIDQDPAAGIQKPIDLQKIFTPASDAEVIQPQKNRKLYASSAFYTPGLHPTVEDQVELARRISSSLSDVSNQQSKGQCMYVHRKKRSVKWVHEGEGHGTMEQYNGYNQESSSTTATTTLSSSETIQNNEKVPLRLVMNPRGQLQDFTILKNQGFTYDNSGMLSPDKCAELVNALHAPKGKGAELFAKRRKRSEKWIIDETTRNSSQIYGEPGFGNSTTTANDHQESYDYSQYELSSDQLAQPQQQQYHQQQLPKLEQRYQSSPSIQPQYVPPVTHSLPKQQFTKPQPKIGPANKTRDLAYKPSVPQGWNAPPVQLPKDIYTPAEISLSSYATPQLNNNYIPPVQPAPAISSTNLYNNQSSFQQFGSSYVMPSPTTFTGIPANDQHRNERSIYQPNVPTGIVRNQSPQPFSASALSTETRLRTTSSTSSFVPTQSKQAMNSTSTIPFNQQTSSRKPLTVPNTIVRNTSPIPFGSSSGTRGIYSDFKKSTLSEHQSIPSTKYGSYTDDTSMFYGTPPLKQQHSTSSSLNSYNTSRLSLDLSNCENYNRAARGWGQMKDYYRPITFTKQYPAPPPQTTVMYSDI